ncbi:MAG: FliI/YscN family ATPase [Sphingomonas sp.]
MKPDPHALLRALERGPVFERRGRLVGAIGTTLRVRGLSARIGDQCALLNPDGGPPINAEVIGLADRDILLTPLADLQGLSIDCEVVLEPDRSRVPCGPDLLGRVIDAHARPLDGKPPVMATPSRPIFAPAPTPLGRMPITNVVETGVRAIDALLTIGQGQRLGVFAAAGGGKSTLMGMLARQTRADAIVIALIGERGREVREFIEDNLGTEGLARAVVVIATAERPAMERVRAAHVATAIAEGMRESGKHVLLLMDSVTRFARALREIGLAAGEPAVRRGFPPSVFAELPRLFERAGNDQLGSITAIYTILLEDEEGDPIGEEVRSLLDGHLILSRKLGARGHYPAIDVLGSLSRLFPKLATPTQRHAARDLRALMAKLDDIALLVQLGEYQPGSDPLADRALGLEAAINAFLQQPTDAASPFAATIAHLRSFELGHDG